MTVTDAAVLASRVDGVVLVVKSDAIPREQLRQAMAMLADVKATVVGGVLNMVDVHRNILTTCIPISTNMPLWLAEDCLIRAR